jgi:hypothetical protein
MVDTQLKSPAMSCSCVLWVSWRSWHVEISADKLAAWRQHKMDQTAGGRGRKGERVGREEERRKRQGGRNSWSGIPCAIHDKDTCTPVTLLACDSPRSSKCEDAPATPGAPLRAASFLPPALTGVLASGSTRRRLDGSSGEPLPASDIGEVSTRF